MDRKTKIKESVLYEIWKDPNFKKIFRTTDEVEIAVLDCGIFNDQLAGPDFKNARVRIGNLTYVGDIEIDPFYTDWKSHGHHIDGKYSKVILHATLINKTNQDSVYTRDGRKIPSVSIEEYVDKKIIEELNNQVEIKPANQYQALKCHSLIELIPFEERENLIIKFAFQRFEKKRKMIFNRLKELQFLDELGVNEPVVSYELSPQFHKRVFDHSDFSSAHVWQQLLYEFIFEALGYSKNKNQMSELAECANVNFLTKIEKDGVILEKYEAALLKISGLDSVSRVNYDYATNNYLERVNLYWASLQPFYDGKFINASTWNFFRMRPQNFPTVRIAGGARIIYEIIQNDLINTVMKNIEEIDDLNLLAKNLQSFFIIKADGFWKKHYILQYKAAAELENFVGESRADEIVVNIILPFFSVYFEIFGKNDLCKKIMQIFSTYTQSIENNVLSGVAESLEMEKESKRAIITQGMLELFRCLCSKNGCLKCEIGKTLFN